jgi:hypothetical protein
VLHSIKMALGPFLQGPIDGIYQLNDQHKLCWDKIVKSSKNDPLAVKPHIFTSDKCRVDSRRGSFGAPKWVLRNYPDGCQPTNVVGGGCGFTCDSEL